MSEHPSPFRLEALMVGEADPEARDHVDGCDECRAYMDGLGREQSAMLEHEPAAAFLARPEIAAAMEAASKPEQVSAWTWLRWLLPIASVGAAAVIFLMGAPAPGGPVGPDEILLKGAAVSVEVIRQRTLGDGTTRQSKHVKAVPVRVGDALRIRLTLARRTHLSVAIIADREGDWIHLTERQWFDAGEHFVPGDALGIEEGPTTGRLVVGSPDAVEAAKRGDRTAQVEWVYLRAEPTQ